jgi:hypothetical protein
MTQTKKDQKEQMEREQKESYQKDGAKEQNEQK